ncbi:hypothetical protein [Roseimicrobium sp. ORNL1]|uniref:hypothetical protein n=1 Tax=Roseimicrobium sp. ORNL1 TaxID=2711231 RepID=UPI0013E14B66|nr:hypothetical protein [Roseimicrobium sp. ORNL1]QIF01781.1 hypothetical protein G5S37_09665 [Roseimicrobium sp. ORNL1]
MIRFKAFLKECELRKLTKADYTVPNMPKDGKFMLDGLAQRNASANVAIAKKDHYTETLEITSHTSASEPYYSDRRILFIIWEGDLNIDGDLLDEDFGMKPILIIKGNLTVRNWLRGGMDTFVGGNVKASGFIIGHYNDSALFVGGDLTAAGYIPRAKPYKDLPNIVPHQIVGKVNAKKFDNTAPTNEQLQAAFVEEALMKEDEDIYIDERAIFERSDAGLTVWK